MRRLAVVLLVLIAGCRKAEQPATDTYGYARTGTQEKTATAAPAEPGAEVGKRMPEYAAHNLDGSAFALAGRNKVVMLNVWATWCGPCRFEIPELQALHEKYGARGFEVIGASVDDADPQVVKDFAAEHNMTYPIVLDPEGKVATILDASVLPTTVLIDRAGTIVWKKIGVIEPDDRELTKAIEKALG